MAEKIRINAKEKTSKRPGFAVKCFGDKEEHFMLPEVISKFSSPPDGDDIHGEPLLGNHVPIKMLKKHPTLKKWYSANPWIFTLIFTPRL